MEQIFNGNAATDFSSDIETRVSSPSYQAYQILRLGFIVAPIVAGLDKFFHLLVNWDQYLPPFVINLLMIPGYFDVALRDFGLSLGALALARLSHEFDR